MNILGLSCYYHDAAAVILKDGVIIAASEEERFSRKKHDSSFPALSIEFCLKKAGLTIDQIDYVVFYEKPFRKFHRILISAFSTYPRSYSMFREAMRVWLTQKLWIKEEISSSLKIDPSKVLFSEHHLSHASSSFYPSPFDKAAILTIDGVGEWTTASFGIGEKNKVKITKEIHYPQSLGLLYSAFTAFLGFEVNEGEWKVMGLAPYGKPKHTDKIWKVVQMFDDGSFALDFSYFSFQHSDKTTYSNKFHKLFGTPIKPSDSHNITKFASDMASSIQKVTEDILVNMTKALHKETKLDNLCISGGVALNCVANYQILLKSGFKNIYIQPAAGDSGAALGAALYAYHHVLSNTICHSDPELIEGEESRTNVRSNKKIIKSRIRERSLAITRDDTTRHILSTAYFGEEYSNDTIELFLKTNNIKYKKMPDNKLVDFVSGQMKKGKVVGWMQGGFEWGPRALGHRSIIADPRNPKMKDIINAKVKFREAFRPFAPSVLAEHAHKVFDLKFASDQRLATNDHIPLRFMLYVVPVKKQWRQKVPAINHADNTARPQLVYKNENPLYHKLISSFYKKTGVPLILNTSFNLRGEAIVNTPENAYSTFQRSGIDLLVMGNFVCEK